MTQVWQRESGDCLEYECDSKIGSQSAQGDLLQRCRKYLLFIASKELDASLRCKVGVSDLVQESLYKAHRNLHDFQGHSDGELFAWLRQILIRTLIDSKRRYKAAKRHGNGHQTGGNHPSKIPEPVETPSVEMIAHENKVAIEKAMLELPEDYRRVIRERIWEQKSFIEIGEAMSRSPEAVRKLWVRGIDQLRRIWQQEHNDGLASEQPKPK